MGRDKEEGWLIVGMIICWIVQVAFFIWQVFLS